MFLNLLVNTANAIEGHGLINLNSSQAGDWVWIEIADNGFGIAADNLTNIFDPFFTTKEIGKGTGLGLHVVKMAIETMVVKLSLAAQKDMEQGLKLFCRSPERLNKKCLEKKCLGKTATISSSQ
ncbi:Sensor protein ZraS [Gammaproteobacteria bacterium MOLA455]|nr:Sensor protein ZraS [Gammaproteobacteria bacterium MOLA455]